MSLTTSSVTPPVAAPGPRGQGIHETRDQIDAEMHGRRMSREEFWSWYEGAGENIRAELIDGVVSVMMPASFGHGEPQSFFGLLLSTYAAQTPGTSTAVGPTVRCVGDECYEPDLVLRVNDEAGGQSSLDDRGFLDGVPELCIEISNTTLQRDLVEKRATYERSGVREYLVHLPGESGETIAMRSVDGTFVSANLVDDCFVSEAFPGLVLDLRAIAAGDPLAALQRLQSEIGSERHQAFVQRLADARETHGKSSNSGSSGSAG